MLSSLKRVLTAVLLLFSLALPAGALALEHAVERLRISGDEAMLDAVLYRPKGDGPFPAVIALHGCGGLWNNAGQLSARHHDWAAFMAGQGFMVLLPDSYGSRGLGSQCGVKDLKVRASRERVADALAMRNFLHSLPDVKGGAISLIGWSSGGSTVLAAIRADRKPGDGRPDIAKAIAFYPACRLQSESTGFEARVPMLMLMGDADDWTPPAPCDRLAKSARGRGEYVDLVLYTGAVHDFDHPSRKPAERQGIAFTADGTGRARVGTDPVAREDAKRRVIEFLAR
ncbi:MAG: dienelactone hydrolase family protein [Bosea sp. (in: a-proteobacteria)]